MTDKEKEELLERFQCNHIRDIEENFAQTFSENENVRLFFINENEAFTDGKNIVVDPAMADAFSDSACLENTENYLGWPRTVSRDPWAALNIITRGQTIHECLHIFYTDFPGGYASDPLCDTNNKKITMSLIFNIIEDAYIEAVGCSVYDNLEMYLKFGRIWPLFVNKQVQGTIERRFGEEYKPKEDIKETKTDSDETGEEKKTEDTVGPLMKYLNYMGEMLLWPMIIQDEPDDELKEYIEQTRQFFFDGSFAPSPDERYDYCRKIFNVILPLIPPDSEKIEREQFVIQFGGAKTHSPESETISGDRHKGKTQTVTVRLFTDKDGVKRDDAVPLEQLMKELEKYAREHDAVISIVAYEGFEKQYSGKDYDCSPLHKEIKINEKHPKINQNLRKAYQNIFNKYRININSYNSRFLQILMTLVPVTEEKQILGSGISSQHMGDPKRRYWYKKVPGMDVPDLSVMLLVDGSGSMDGARQKAAMQSCVIIHEVLRKQGIEHCIVEHRAGGDEPEIDVNILVNFNAREDEKLNIMQIDAYGDNRDGLALMWAERYMAKQSSCENKLIVVLSDGYPAHEADDYYPPVSTKDTANIVRKIMKRGTSIIAVSLDDEDSYDCYDNLKEIYPEIVACNDLNRLTGQLLTVISRQLR